MFFFTHGLNEELGRHSTRNSSKVIVRVCKACFMGMLSTGVTEPGLLGYPGIMRSFNYYYNG